MRARDELNEYYAISHGPVCVGLRWVRGRGRDREREREREREKDRLTFVATSSLHSPWLSLSRFKCAWIFN